MSDPFLGQISSVGFNFPPTGWMLCQGQTLPISQYTALFSLLGTSYGGNGTTNFQLPNLQGNVPINYGTGPGLTPYNIGETDGAENVTLTLATTPPHNHSFTVQDTQNSVTPPTAGMAFAKTSPGSQGPLNAYALPSNGTATILAASAMGPSPSGNQPHNNMQPSLAINWCIAISGVYPARQ